MRSVRRLGNEQRVDFAHQFRAARAKALRDAEAFEEHLFVMERLGSYVLNAHGNLKRFQAVLERLARESPLAFEAEKNYPDLHLSFAALYEEATIARNDAMHHGAIARHLAGHAQELALIMEDSLMSTAKKARDFMVRSPECAELWQPLSAIRRTMLVNAFSFLPFESNKGEWKLISDCNLVNFIRCSSDNRKKRLLMTLEAALVEGLQPTKADRCGIDEPIEKLAASMENVPWLVFDKEARLIGLITAYDLL
jgi:CBS domain-containing protein